MKVVVVGAGNGGCFTALHWGWHTRNNSDVEVELIYIPETVSYTHLTLPTSDLV